MEEPPYLYLPDSPFDTDFDQAVGDAEGPFRVYVCIYSMPYAFTIDKTVSAIPYLRFIAVKTDVYTFPSFECTVSDFDTQYVNCIMQLFDLNVTETPPEPGVFKVEQVIVRDKSAIVFCPYDAIASLIKPLSQDGKFSTNSPNLFPIEDRNPYTTMKWSVVDEIVYEQRMLGVPFDGEVTAFFREHESTHNISYDMVYIDFPFSVYPVKESDGTYTNILRNPIAADAKNEENSLINGLAKIHKYSENETYGSRYGFTYQPIGGELDLALYIRYVIYTHRTKYAIESGEQSGGDADEEFGKLIIPTIYFMQDINGTPTQMWGVQSSTQFAEL